MADPFIDAMGLVLDSANTNSRTATPGKIEAIKRDQNGELDVDFIPGPGRRQGTEITADGPVASAPVLHLSGGGFGFSFPMATGDEGLAIVADRNTQRWRQNREPGDAHAFDRAHNLSDSMILPLAIQAAHPIGDTLKIYGPAGVAIEIADDGAVTISSNAAPPNASTITMTADGNVSITVGPGKTIDLGGSAISPATKWDQLDAAMTAFIAALVSAGAGPGYAGAAGAQTAWQNAIAAATPAASKVEVE